MILAGLTTPLLGLVDTAVVGHLDGPEYLAGVALGSLIFSFLFWGLGFLRMGTGGLAAQAFGAGDAFELRVLLARAVLLALFLGLILWLLRDLIAALAFPFFDSEAEVLAQARLYYEVRIWGAPFVLVSYVYLGWLLGIQAPRAVLLLSLVTNAVNILLDLLLVVVWQWGVAGVAWASVWAEATGALLALWLGRRLLPAVGEPWLARLRDWRPLLRLLAVNQDLFLRTLLLIASFAFFTVQGAALGEGILAANALLFNFVTFMAYALDGFAHAAQALVGRYLGAGERTRMNEAVRAAGIWSAWLALAFAVVYFLAGETLVALLTDIDSVRTTAAQYLPWLMLAPLVAFWCYWLDGVFLGAMLSRQMRNTMVLAVAVYLAAWWLSRELGNHGLWLSLMVFFAARGLTMAWVWRRRQADLGHAAKVT